MFTGLEIFGWASGKSGWAVGFLVSDWASLGRLRFRWALVFGVEWAWVLSFGFRVGWAGSGELRGSLSVIGEDGIGGGDGDSGYRSALGGG